MSDITDAPVFADDPYWQVKLAKAAQELASSGASPNVSNATGTLAIAHGGTGATTAAAARANLGFTVGANIASAATVDLNTATGWVVTITGSASITSLLLAEGRVVFVTFTGNPTFVDTNIRLFGPYPIVPSVGDRMTFIGDSTGKAVLASWIPYNKNDFNIGETRLGGELVTEESFLFLDASSNLTSLAFSALITALSTSFTAISSASTLSLSGVTGVYVPSAMTFDGSQMDINGATVNIPNLPTSNPAVAGQLWVDTAAGFVVKQSQG